MPTVYEREQAAILRKARKRRARVLSLREDGHTLNAIGELLGISHQRVAQLEKKARQENGS